VKTTLKLSMSAKKKIYCTLKNMTKIIWILLFIGFLGLSIGIVVTMSEFSDIFKSHKWVGPVLVSLFTIMIGCVIYFQIWKWKKDLINKGANIQKEHDKPANPPPANPPPANQPVNPSPYDQGPSSPSPQVVQPDSDFV
jgi:glucan phosphoethanolaminetransferase (alkaline phosphatase superfamily)